MVEWRLKNKRPFAIIYRLTILLEYTGKPGASKLMVETIGTASKPGCRIAEIDGDKPNANIEARAAAEALLKGTAKCLYAH